jgi:ATP-dependent DNA helicase RecG
VGGLLNVGGGRVVLGITTSGAIQGVLQPERIATSLRRYLTTGISPKSLWSLEAVTIAEQNILLLEVPEGMDKPYIVEGGIPLCVKNRIVAAGREQISDLIRRHSAASQRWERQVVVGAEWADLDEILVKETLRLALASERWSGSPDDLGGFMNSLGIMTGDGVSHAALILFGKKPARFLPQARVRLMILPEGKTGNQYALDKMLEGPLLRVAAQIPQELSAHTGVVGRFNDRDWQRQEHQRYPMSALREAVMNALVHRDYESSGAILIAIDAKSLRISNPGSLPAELTPADLRQDHPSLPRNPDIAHVCYLHRLIEKIGRGTQRILEDCRQAGIEPPKWESSAGQTSITFMAAAGRKPTERQTRILDLVNQYQPISSRQLAAHLDDLPERTLRLELQALFQGGFLSRQGATTNLVYTLPAKAGSLNQRQSQILGVIRQNHSIKLADLKQTLGIAVVRTLSNDLRKLEKEGLIRREGKTSVVSYQAISDD